jgi:hypothetical protein
MYLTAGNLFGLDERARAEFGRELVKDAHRISDDELRLLLKGRWRERLTAAWFAGVDRRTSFREDLGDAAGE